MNEEAINLLTKDVAFWDNEGSGRIAQIPRDDYDQAIAKLSTEQPPAGEKEKIETRIFEGLHWVNARDWNKLLARLDRSDERNKQLKMLNTIFLTNSQEKEEQLKVQFDRSEASRKDLLTACVEFCQQFSDYGRICNPKTTNWRHSQEYKEKIIAKFEATIAKEKEVKK